MVLPHWQGSTHQGRQDHHKALASSPRQHCPLTHHFVRGHSDPDPEVEHVAKGRTITRNSLGRFLGWGICRRLPTSSHDLSCRNRIPARTMACRSHRSNYSDTRSPSPRDPIPLCDCSWISVPWNFPVPVNIDRDRIGSCKAGTGSDRISHNYRRNPCDRHLSTAIQSEFLQHTLTDRFRCSNSTDPQGHPQEDETDWHMVTRCRSSSLTEKR